MPSDAKPNFIAAHRKAIGMADHELAEKVGTSQAQINRLENGKRNLTVKWLERIGHALGKTTEQMLKAPSSVAINDPDDLDRSVIASAKSDPVDFPQGNAEWVDEPTPRRPVRKWINELGRAAGGREGMFTLSNSDVVDRDLCPPEVINSKDPYLVRVVGDSMVPRFKERERLVVDPDEAYAKGDEVVVQLRTDDPNVFESYVKEFVSYNARELVLKQHNPPKGSDAIMRFPKSRVHRIHKVVSVQLTVKHKT